MFDHRIMLLRLLSELDQQLAEANESIAVPSVTVAEVILNTEIIDGLRAALENVEMQLERDRRPQSQV